MDGFDWRVPRDMTKQHLMALVVDEGSGSTMTYDHGVIGPGGSSSRTWADVQRVFDQSCEVYNKPTLCDSTQKGFIDLRRRVIRAALTT